VLTTNEKYLDIVKSNVRPKIEPYITVSGKDVEIQWKPSNIIDMTYKRGIDPTGQTLPYMELTWKEFYFGKLNENNYPEKYNNVAKYMKVNLWFEQDTSNINTWGDVLNGISYDEDTDTAKSTWDDFSSNTWNELTGTWDSPMGSTLSVVSGETHTWGEYTPKTWGEVFRNQNKLKIEFPSLILVARPTIQGHTITWTARDPLYFFSEKIEKSFKEGIPLGNPIKWLFLNERGNFLNSEQIITFTSNSVAEVPDIRTSDSPSSETLDKIVYFNGTTKDLLKNYACIFNYYWDFDVNSSGYSYAKMNYFGEVSFTPSISPSTYPSVFTFTKKIMKSNPEIIRGKNISSFLFNQYIWELDSENSYKMMPTETLTYVDSYGNSIDYYKYLYKGLSTSETACAYNGKIIGTHTYGLENTEINVIPVIETKSQATKNNNKMGEVYVEDNPLCYFDLSTSQDLKQRAIFLDCWYSENSSDIVINSSYFT
jgi:hypothetical protein